MNDSSVIEQFAVCSLVTVTCKSILIGKNWYEATEKSNKIISCNSFLRALGDNCPVGKLHLQQGTV